MADIRVNTCIDKMSSLVCLVIWRIIGLPLPNKFFPYSCSKGLDNIRVGILETVEFITKNSTTEHIQRLKNAYGI